MNDPYILNGEHPAERVLQQVPGVPAHHVAMVLHALADLTHQKHMLSPSNSDPRFAGRIE